MQSRITGTTMPVLEFVLEPNESIISEAGELPFTVSAVILSGVSSFAKRMNSGSRRTPTLSVRAQACQGILTRNSMQYVENALSRR